MTPLDLDELERAHGEIGRDDAFCNSPSPVYRIWDAFPALLRELRARRAAVKKVHEIIGDCRDACGPCYDAIRDALEPAAPAKGGEGEK